MPAIQNKIVDIGDWARRNIWPLPSGELAVRPAMRDLVAAPSSSAILAAFSARSDQTDEVHHYIVARNTSTDVVGVYIYNEILESQFSIEWGSSKPETVTHGIVNGQVMIGAPGLPPLWGYLGQPLYLAKRKARSLNPDLATQPLPRGLIVGWANRIVYADGGELFFSDAGDPRSIVNTNFVNPTGGAIMGLHVSNAGALIIVTTDGVYRFSREAAAAGQVVKGVLDKVCDYAAPRPGCTATVRGRVWGVTRRGVRLVDTPDPYEIMVGDPRVRSSVFPLATMSDFRAEGALYEGEDGLILAMPSADQACFFDEASQTFSWWDSAGAYGFDVVGTLMDESGKMLIATTGGVVQPLGNDEGGLLVYGTFRGRVQTHPGQSATMRSVQVSTDSMGVAACAADATLKASAVPQDPDGVIAGTATTGTGTWKTAPMRSREFNFALRTDDHTLEIGASVCLSRIDGAITVQLGGIERERVSN